MSTDPNSVSEALSGPSSMGGTSIAVLRAWKATLLDLNRLLAAKGFEPLESRSTYELLTAMKGYPEKMPHKLAVIEWAFHASNLSGANRHVGRYGGSWSESTRQAFWSEEFDRTCDLVKKILKDERLKLGPQELPYDVQQKYVHWSFARMEQHVRVRPPLEQAMGYGGNNGWDGRSIWNLVRRGPLPVKAEPEVLSPDTSKMDEDMPDNDMDNLYHDEPHDKNDGNDSEGSEWECVATPSSSSVYLDDEEYEDVQMSQPIEKNAQKFQPLKPFDLILEDAQVPELFDDEPFIRTERRPSLESKFVGKERVIAKARTKPTAAWKPYRRERPSSTISETPGEDVFKPLFEAGMLPIREGNSETRPAVAGADSPDWMLDSDRSCEQVNRRCQDHLINTDGTTSADQMSVELVGKWQLYWQNSGNSTLERWQKLLADLGQQGDFSSILKCKIALKPLWINIEQFLSARNKPEDVILFSSERRLAAYTQEHGGMIAISRAKQHRAIQDFSALRMMLAKVKRHMK